MTFRKLAQLPHLSSRVEKECTLLGIVCDHRTCTVGAAFELNALARFVYRHHQDPVLASEDLRTSAALDFPSNLAELFDLSLGILWITPQKWVLSADTAAYLRSDMDIIMNEYTPFELYMATSWIGSAIEAEEISMPDDGKNFAPKIHDLLTYVQRLTFYTGTFREQDNGLVWTPPPCSEV
ncbi:MAG TPA: hypothetical protein VJJ82_02770, partial [Candidatus Nanoarchaeia archaeon]|nr:hypothetical protein [Candidatus Nanoarchaeia archaeon]